MRRKKLNKARVEQVRNAIVDCVAEKRSMPINKLLDAIVLLNRVLSDMEDNLRLPNNVTTTTSVPVKYYFKFKNEIKCEK